MESDVTLARDQPVPMLEYPISFPSLSLSSLMDYDDDETMIFDGLSLPNLKDEDDDESPLSDQMKMKIAETVTDTKSVSSTREQASEQSNLDMWFERGQSNHIDDMTMQESTIHKIIESLGNDSEESITKTDDGTKTNETTIHKIIKSLEDDSEESIRKFDDTKPHESAISKIIESLGDNSNERVTRTNTENYTANVKDDSKSSNFLPYCSNSHENCTSVGDQILENMKTPADSDQSNDGHETCAKDSVLDRNYFEMSSAVADYSITDTMNDSIKVTQGKSKSIDVSNDIIASDMKIKMEISTRSNYMKKSNEPIHGKSNVDNIANDILNSGIKNTIAMSHVTSNVEDIANDIMNSGSKNETEVSARSSNANAPIEFTKDKCKTVEILNDISNIDIINKTDLSTRSRKRKQSKPRLIPQETLDNESNDEDSENEWSYVRKKALFSKLYVPKKVMRRRKQLKGDHVLTRCAIIEIIEDSLRAPNDPDTTNRYRRHLMKQSQKSFTSQTDEHEDAESQTNGITSDINEIDHRQTICDDSNRNMAAGDSAIDDMPDNDPLECKRCGKHFTTRTTLSAHYEFHKNVEKDFENTHFVGLNLKVNDADHTEDGHHGDDDEEEDSSDSDDSDDSDVESEQSVSKSREPADGDLLETSTYFCQVCQTRFTNIGALQHHMQEHNTSDGEPVSENEAKGDHYCGVCQKNFASAASLHVHNKIHSGDNPYTCPTCNKSFRDKTRLTTHIRVHTGEKPFVCSICQKSFSQKGNLKLHQKIHTGERNCICQVCGNGFRSRSDLVRHMKVHGLALSSGSENEETTPKVPVTMTITSPPIRLQHESQEAQTKFHRSNKIKDLLEANDNIGSIGISPGMKNINELHKLGVANPSLRSRPSQDSLEGYHRNDAFINLVPKYPGIDANAYLMNLNREVEFIKAMTEAKMRSEATAIKSYICPLCGISLPSFDAFNHHVLLQHNPITTFGPLPNSPFAPSKASPHKHASSPSIFSLLDPFLAVPKTDKFKCKDCNEVFHTNEDLTIHSKTHRNKNADTKGPVLSQNHDGPVTSRDHGGLTTSRGQGGPVTSREYGVPMTSQNHGGPVMSRDHGVGSFLSSTAIMEDMKLVSSEKLYSCEFCGKTFRRSHHLQTHMRTHTGDRPYTCVECNKCFARGDHLQNHRRTHTGEKPYRCDICNRSYSQSHHLLRHKRTHTGERPYQCSLCEKTFSRDHHLKKHLETHRDMVDVPEQRETKTEAQRTHGMGRLTDASSNRMGALMMDMRPEHSASKLMESMIKRHLREEEERKLSKHESTGNYIVGKQEIEHKREQKREQRKESLDNYSVGMQEMEYKKEQKREPRKESTDTYSVGSQEREQNREQKREQRMELMDKFSVGRQEREQKTDQKREQRQESLKITDILNDEIDKRMTAHISTDLILDHVMMLARPKPGVKVASESLSHEKGVIRRDIAGKYSSLEQALKVGYNNQSPKISDNMSKLSDFYFQSNLFSSQSHVSSSASLPLYSHVHSSSSREGIRYEPREGTTTLNRSESREGIHQESPYKVTEHAPSTASMEGIRYEPGERIITANRSETREAIHQESPYRVKEREIKVPRGTLHSNRLEPKTLDDIVLKSLQDEYNIKHS